MIVEAALQQPQTAQFEPVDMVDRFDASKAEARPTGPDSADGLNEFLSVNFGAEFAWPSQKGAENVRKGPVAGASGGADSRLHSFETGHVVWVKLGRHWWPARISSMQDLPDKVWGSKQDGKVLVHFFDHWDEAATVPAKRMYQWTHRSYVRDFVEGFNALSGARVSQTFKDQVGIALGLLPDFKPAGWEVKVVSSDPRAVDPKASGEDRQSADGASELGVSPPGPVLPLEETLTDDQYFQQRALKQEKKTDKPIRLKLPAVKLVDTGVPEELAALQKYLHELCLLYTSPSPRDQRGSRMPSSA